MLESNERNQEDNNPQDLWLWFRSVHRFQVSRGLRSTVNQESIVGQAQAIYFGGDLQWEGGGWVLGFVTFL